MPADKRKENRFPGCLLRENETGIAWRFAWEMNKEHALPACSTEGTEGFGKCLKDDAERRGIVYDGAFYDGGLISLLGIRSGNRRNCIFL